MIKKVLINLGTSVPPNAVTATVDYTTSDGAAPAKLYRFDGDPNPLSLDGTKGRVELDLVRGRDLYLETIDNASWNVICSGYSF